MQKEHEEHQSASESDDGLVDSKKFAFDVEAKAKERELRGLRAGSSGLGVGKASRKDVAKLD